jgi:hypothetical protein
MGGACNTLGEKRSAYRILVGKPEGKRLLGRHRCRWEVNIKIEFIDLGLGAWTWFTWWALVNTVMNLQVP